MLRSGRIYLICLLLLPFLGFSQPSEEEFGYFIFPIKPGVRNTLSGTMGELRSTHFHTGIDIRTGGQQGLAVLAAADGYISRIKVAPGGYGNTIYMMHPNGKTTVYAHLKSFNKVLHTYIKDAQYKKKSFEVNLFPGKNEFNVSQGDTIALSGNSGSSGGPHLHFDIRDEGQNLLNPLKYGFTEVIDTRSPYARSLALVTFNNDARVDGEFGRFEYKLTGTGNMYIFSDTINAIGNIGLELYAWDRMNGTRFKTGITEIKLEIDNNELFGQNIDTWSFSRARSFYQHVNYKSLVTKGRRFHKLYVDNGNTLRFYDPSPTNGRVNIEKGKYYNVHISMTDSYGNESVVKAVIYGSSTKTKTFSRASKSSLQTHMRNTLKIVGDSLSGSTVSLKFKDNKITLESAYDDNDGNPVFLWDLSKAIPEAFELGDTSISTNIISMIPPKHEYKVFNAHADIIFKKNSLFDTLFFNFNYQMDTILNIEKIQIGNKDVPIKGSVTASIKPSINFINKDQAAVYAVYGKNKFSFVGGNWKEDRIAFKMRSFGVYTILVDSIPPEIKPLIINNQRIVFKLSDKRSGIKKIKATLDGEWLLIAKNPKKKQYWAEKHHQNDNYTGELKLEVTDNAGNVKVYNTKIK